MWDDQNQRRQCKKLMSSKFLRTHGSLSNLSCDKSTLKLRQIGTWHGYDGMTLDLALVNSLAHAAPCVLCHQTAVTRQMGFKYFWFIFRTRMIFPETLLHCSQPHGQNTAIPVHHVSVLAFELSLALMSTEHTDKFKIYLLCCQDCRQHCSKHIKYCEH